MILRSNFPLASAHGYLSFVPGPSRACNSYEADLWGKAINRCCPHSAHWMVGLASLDERTDFLSFPCKVPDIPGKWLKTLKWLHFLPKRFARTRTLVHARYHSSLVRSCFFLVSYIYLLVFNTRFYSSSYENRTNINWDFHEPNRNNKKKACPLARPPALTR